MTERMTPEEFASQEEELLSRLSPEVRSAVSWMAYDRGHAYGYEECLIHVQEMVENLEEPLQNLVARVILESAS